MPYFRLGKREGEPCDTTIVSSNEIAIEGEIRVYPNPSSGLINFEFVSPINSEMSLTVYDVSGRLVRQIELPRNAHRKSFSLKAGVYFYSIRSELRMVKNGKLIVIN